MKELLVRCCAIGLAGSMGALTRFGVGKVFLQFTSMRFPLATFFINVTGSLFLGWFLTYAADRNISETTRLAIAVGFVGAYTTFSTYMYDSFKLMDEGALLEAAVNLLGSMILGLFAVWLGTRLARLT